MKIPNDLGSLVGLLLWLEFYPGNIRTYSARGLVDGRLVMRYWDCNLKRWAYEVNGAKWLKRNAARLHESTPAPFVLNAKQERPKDGCRSCEFNNNPCGAADLELCGKTGQWDHYKKAGA